MIKKEMLESVSNYLSHFGPVNKKILEAMDKIDRKNFMSLGLKSQAYVDTAMPTEKGQTISQPSTVARMLQLLELKKGDSVLEVGAGSGWNAALIGFLVGEKGKVVGLEIFKELIKKAKERVKNQGLKNIEIKQKDFLKITRKFDKIIFTAGILYPQETKIEEFAYEHLKNKGILVCPYRCGPLIIMKKQENKIKKTLTKEDYVFVPLIINQKQNLYT